MARPLRLEFEGAIIGWWAAAMRSNLLGPWRKASAVNKADSGGLKGTRRELSNV
jgi:hypothetical protein